MWTKSGAITAPVARTTPNSTVEIPRKANDHVTMRLMWLAIRSACEPAGTNKPNACVSRISIMSTIEQVYRMLYTTPMRAIEFTRSHLHAPTFCAAMEETAMLTANAGIRM